MGTASSYTKTQLDTLLGAKAAATALATKADLVGGLVPTSQLPAIALETATPVANRAAMLALTSTQVQPGDVAIDSSNSATRGSYVLAGTDPSQISNWLLLNAPLDTVQSVNGQTGTVVLAKSDVGLGNVQNTADADKPVSTAQAAALATKAAFGETANTSDQVRALATYPLATGLTITVQASGSTPSAATSTVTGTILTPSWAPSTYYPVGATVLDPSTPNFALNTLVRTTAGTSGSTYDATEQGKWSTRTGGGPTGYPVRYNAARLRSSEGNGVPIYFPRDRHKTDSSELAQYAFRPQQWSIDFDWYTAAGALEVPVFGNCHTRFIVDGKYASISPTFPVPAAPAANDFSWRMVKLSGVTAGYHRVRIEVGGSQPNPGGVKIATGDQVFPPTIPQTKSMVIIGDSIAEGAAGVDSSSAPITADLRGYAAQLGRLLGISNYYSLAVSASGYTLPTTQPFVAGVQDIAALAPDYVLVASTGNDQNNLSSLPAAVADFCTQLKAALAGLPNTKVVISGVPIYGTGSSVGETINPIIKSAAAAAGLTYLDTTAWDYGLPAALISNDNLHPTVAGAEYVARRYAAALGPIWGIPT